MNAARACCAPRSERARQALLLCGLELVVHRRERVHAQARVQARARAQAGAGAGVGATAGAGPLHAGLGDALCRWRHHAGDEPASMPRMPSSLLAPPGGPAP